MDFFMKLLIIEFHLYANRIQLLKMKCSGQKLAKKLNSPFTSRKPTKIQKLIPPKTQSSRLSHPMGGLWSIIFPKTFRISCGELVDQVRTLKIGIGAI
jgi:hypothetical protein